jgi:chromosome partitioning protein
MQDHHTAVIAVANHKGGCGKTTTVVQLAAEFGRLGQTVLVVDLDPQANASLHIGLLHPSEVPVSTAELLLADLDQLPRAIHEQTHLPNVHLIYGSLHLGRTEDELRERTPRPAEELRVKLEPLMGLYDVILIDCPPSLKLLTSNALTAATSLIIPIESGSQYGLYGVTDLMRHVARLRRINPALRLLGALLVRHDERQTVCKLIEQAAAEQVGALLPVRIPSSTRVNQAAMAQTSLYQLDRNARVSRAFAELASHLQQQLSARPPEEVSP